MELFPAIDLLEGCAVRLKEGQYESQTVYSKNPVELAQQIESSGVKNLHVVDLTGAKDPLRRQFSLIRDLVQSSTLKIQYGGGIRSLNDVAEVLNIGIRRVILGSVAVLNPKLTFDILKEFGSEVITLALDVRVQPSGEIRLATNAWQKTVDIDFHSLLRNYSKGGLNRILCTDIGKDGLLTGPNFELYRKLMEDFPEIEIQASGGVSSLDDLRRLNQLDVHSVIVGKAMYEGKFSLQEALSLC